jgi:WS/DGAT/MGAT family acyltransferase
MAIRQVEPQDATFLYIEAPNRSAHATCVWLYTPQRHAAMFDLDALRQHVRARLHVARFLHQKLVRVPLDLDYPYWADEPSIDLDHHVFETTLPAPADWSSFCQSAASIHSRPLDLSRPPWELHLVRGLEFEWLEAGAFAILLKLHHVALDGASSIALMEGLHDDAPQALAHAADAPRQRISYTAPDPLRMLSAALRNNLDLARRGGTLVTRIARRMPKFLAVVRLRGLLGGPATPQTLFNQDVSEERSFGMAFAELDEIRELRKVVPGSTVNDVLLAVCSGALRRFLESRDSLPSEALISLCPMNVRTTDEAHHEGNRIAAIAASLHTNIADPLERLRAIHRSTRRAKGVLESIGAREVLELNSSIPSVLQSAAIALIDRLPRSTRLPRLFNLAISNLPGPRRTMYLGGARLLRMGGVMPVSNGFGLFIVVCTYDGKVSFSVTSGRNILPDAEQLMVHFRHALAELRQAAASAGALPALPAAAVRAARRRPQRVGPPTT